MVSSNDVGNRPGVAMSHQVASPFSKPPAAVVQHGPPSCRLAPSRWAFRRGHQPEGRVHRRCRAVCGPIHATTVQACGLPAIPTGSVRSARRREQHRVEPTGLDCFASFGGRWRCPNGAVGSDVVDFLGLKPGNQRLRRDVHSWKEDPIDRINLSVIRLPLSEQASSRLLTGWNQFTASHQRR